VEGLRSHDLFRPRLIALVGSLVGSLTEDRGQYGSYGAYGELQKALWHKSFLSPREKVSFASSSPCGRAQLSADECPATQSGCGFSFAGTITTIINY
jgi:hypothetical protein